MHMINVLIFPSGGENAYEIYDSLKYNLSINIFGATSKNDYSEMIYEKNKLFIGKYNIADKNFFSNFNKLLKELSIDVVIPTHDTIAEFLAGNRNKLEAKVLTASAETSSICRSKIKTMQLFKNEDFCPKFYLNREDKIEKFPLFVKPDKGQGGQGVFCVKTLKEYLQKMRENFIACEFLPGKEYTIDCFTDIKGKLRFCGKRTRENISNGISIRSRNCKEDKYIKNIAENINKRLKFIGAWFFQVKEDEEGQLKLMEVACRQAGTMMLFRNRGINFALLGIFTLLGKDIDIIDNGFDIMLDRRLEAKYKINIKYDYVYLDYDDTLILDNKVVLDVISFLYYCKNKNKKIFLISRHNEEHIDTVEESLRSHNIDSRLFEKIIKLKFTESKANYISEKDAIFIDNSFKERKEVFEKCGIPVFDVDVVKNLIEI